MDVREFLDSHGLTHLAEILAGFRDLQSLQTLASDEDALDALDLISRDAKKLLAAIRTIPSKTLSHGLPTVLALPLLEFEREANPVLALWAMCDFVELTLKLCVMAAAAEHSTLPEPMLRVFYNRIERPTLAAWHDMAQVASDHLLENSVLSKLPSTFAAIHQIIGSDAGSPASSVLSLRNRLAHARPASTEATQWLKAWRRPLRSLVIDSLSWLREARFIAIEEHGQPCLLRGETGLELEEASPVPADAAPGSAWFCLGDRALPLGLLAAFDFENRAPMVYMRTQDLGLHYLRIAPTGGVWESDLGSWHAFRDRFLKRQGPPAARTIRSFEEEILRESQRRIGRERELHELTEAVTRLKAGQCLWVGGTAGIGKSNLMAALMQRLLETPPENILVLPYRFRSQDDRNNRATFLTYFLEQLDLWECLRPHASGEEEREPESQTFASPQSSGPVMEVVNSLTRIGPEKRVLLVVDGLDEIVERDARFVDDALLRFLREGVSIVGAGRPELGIPESFRKRNAVEPFPAGLPPMSDTEVRGMLLESLFGAGRRGLLQSEHENGSHGTFVEQVARRSEGLPIYVNYVIGDIFARRIRPENPEELPRGVHAYHEELLRRCAVGDLQALITPMLVMLALAAEALSVEEVAALLRRFGRLETQNLHLVERGLKALGSMLSRTTEPNGKNGLKLYHHSLRTHILQNPNLAETVASVARGLAEASLAPHREEDAAECYLYRHGVRHLLEVHRFKDAVQIQTDFQLLMTRFRKLDESGRAAEDWYADWERLRKAGIFEGDTQVWWDFARANRHCFRAEGWESWRVLFQAAIDHADDSPVTIAAERFLAEGRVNWIWLRYINRPKQFTYNLLAVMEGLHLGIDGALELKTGKIISWRCFQDDFWIYVWNPDTGDGERCLTLPPLGTFSLALYPMEVWELKDGIVVFVLTLDLVVILDPETFQCIYAERSEFFSNDPNQLKDKKIHVESGARLHFRANRSPDWNYFWDSPFPFEGTEKNIYLFFLKLSDGRILTINYSIQGYLSYMLIWNPTSSLPEAAFWGHDIYRNILGAIELKDGRILSWSEDDTLRLWDPKITTSQEEIRLFDPYDTPYLIDIGKQLLVWSQSQHARNSRGPNPKSCTILNAYNGSYDGTVGQRCPEGKINLKDGRILSWRKNYLHLWSNNKRKVTATLKGHRNEIESAIEFNAGRLLSWDSEGEARFWRIDDGHCEAVISFQQNEKPPEELKNLKNGNLLLTDCEYLFSRGSLLDLKDKNISFCIFNTKTFKRETTFQLPVHHLFKLKPKLNTWYGEKIQLLELKNGNILILLSTIENNSLLIILNPLTGSLKLISSGWAKSARRAIELNDGRIAFIQRGADELVIWEANQKKHSRLKSPDLHLKDAIKLQDGRIAAWSLEKILLISDKSCSRWDSETPFAKFQIANLKEFKDGTLIGWADINEREDGTGNAWDSIMNGRPFMRNSGLIFFFRDTNSVPHSINLEILSPSELSSSGIETLKRNISDIPKSIFEIFNLVNASNDSHVDTYQESGLCATFGGRVLRLQGLD